MANGNKQYGYECNNCKKPAFWLEKEHRIGDALLAKNVYFNDNRIVEAGDKIICQYCGCHIISINIGNVKLFNYEK